jgi:hypothetical protein
MATTKFSMFCHFSFQKQLKFTLDNQQDDSMGFCVSKTAGLKKEGIGLGVQNTLRFSLLTLLFY